jgi:hypothetical protein
VVAGEISLLKFSTPAPLHKTLSKNYLHVGQDSAAPDFIWKQPLQPIFFESMYPTPQPSHHVSVPDLPAAQAEHPASSAVQDLLSSPQPHPTMNPIRAHANTIKVSLPAIPITSFCAD